MTAILADSFRSALTRLTNDERKQAKQTVYDLQDDPSQPGLQFHRVEKARSDNIWSVRVGRDIRIIVQRLGGDIVIAYVGHHDDAYDWAERRRIEAHPTTGALQIVEVRELVETVAVPNHATVAPQEARTFERLSRDQLMSMGVPDDWIGDVLAATDDSFLALAHHLPSEASDALMDYAQNGRLTVPAPVPPEADPLQHPDTQRRFRAIEGAEEMRAALDAPFEKWAVFLHPMQRETVEKVHGGPARVVGSAGTGKTVVALHRAMRILRLDPDARVLLTTFSEPLSRSLHRKLRLMAGDRPDFVERVRVGSFLEIAKELYRSAIGSQLRTAKAQAVRSQLASVANALEVTEVSSQFLYSEWDNVIDAWQIDTLEAYAEVPRIGRKSRLGPRQRERLWGVFAALRRQLSERGLLTESGVFAAVTTYYRERGSKPFTHIVVDEAQDLGVPELRFLAALAPPSPDSLFFAGDLGQRIFRQPFSWMRLGVDVRGRSATLRVNYRTSHQIRRAADRLLPDSISDLDGISDDRSGTISVFDGAEPEISVLADAEAETAHAAEKLKGAVADGFSPGEIGVFVRSEAQLSRARAAVRKAGLQALDMSGDSSEVAEAVVVGTMHLAKGLEFRMVLLMACDENVLPLEERTRGVADQFEVDEVVNTERQLLYVAATRARDRLVITATEPASEFLDDLRLF